MHCLAIFPSGCPSWPPATPPSSIPFMCVPINSQYIWFVKCAVPKNANKNKIKIWVDSLLKSLSIPLETPQFPAHLSLESRFYEQFCRGGADHAIGIPQLGQADIKLSVACLLFSFFNKLHYRHEIDAYKYNFHHVQEPYLARLGPNGLFLYQQAWRVCSPHVWCLN